jgi:aldehyde dehydrogenase (NAD+)
MQSLQLGNPLDKNTDIGAINSEEQLEIINKYIDIGIKEGSEFFQTDCILPAKGYYCRPTLFINVAQSSVLAQEEIFGPVLTIQTFRTVDEVIQKANNSPYGLAAGVWTDKGSKIFNLTSKLKAGVIWANTYNKFDPASPFGGYKESGFGREGGLHGLGAYLK